MRVLRYPLRIGRNVIELHPFAELLHVDIKANEDGVSLWALEYDNPDRLTRRFHIVGTGHPFELPARRHIGSALDPSRMYVWHVFEAQGNES